MFLQEVFGSGSFQRGSGPEHFYDTEFEGVVLKSNLCIINSSILDTASL